LAPIDRVATPDAQGQGTLDAVAESSAHARERPGHVSTDQAIWLGAGWTRGFPATEGS
jgi:hypothetical protein